MRSLPAWMLSVCLACGDTAATDSDSGPRVDRDGGGRADVGSLDGGAPREPGLVRWEDFEFAGAFRLPADRFGISELNFSAGPIEIGASGDSVFLVGHAHQQAIAEFAMPALVVSETLGDLEMSGAPLQTFATVLDRASGGNPDALDTVTALDLAGSSLVVHAIEYYDAPADNSDTTLVVRDASDLAGSAVDGYFALEGVAHAAGWISDVPPEWQAALGGPHIAGGSSGWPIISRLSVGPTAFVFDRDAIASSASTPGRVPARALLDYDLDRPIHDDLMNEGGSNDLWTHLSRAVFGFIVPGTRSYVTLGHSGGHAGTGVCYKCVPIGETAECGGYCSVDPNDYALYYWFYDVEDLVSVAEGRAAPTSCARTRMARWTSRSGATRSAGARTTRRAGSSISRCSAPTTSKASTRTRRSSSRIASGPRSGRVR